MLSPLTVKAQKSNLTEDKFELTTSEVPASGTKSSTILFNAPPSEVKVMGKIKHAKIIVDLSRNVLYKYDDNGNAEKAYLVASGKKSSPTTEGLRIVTHVETYPYRSAPASTKRRKHPQSYGPKIICLRFLDPVTGETSSTGEFIHGNNNPSSIGKFASLGCVRMDNEVIKELAKEVKRGDIVLMQKGF